MFASRRLMLLASVGFAASSCITSWFTSTRSEFIPPDPETLDARIAAEGSTGNGKVDHFAVLIGADTELHHRGNLSMAYQVLIEQGYPRDHIYILDSEGDTPYFPITDVTTRASVTHLFQHLERVVEKQDTLFIYMTGHGRHVTADEDSDGKKGEVGVSSLVLNLGEELAQDEFSRLLDRISPEAGIAFLDNCYWAPFTSPKLCNYVFVTTTQSASSSHGQTFPRAFWGAFRERRGSNGEPSRPSIFEAFKFAMVADRATTLGLNKPRISHGCVDPSSITLLGAPRGTQTSTSSR